MARREGPPDDLLRLGDVEPALGLGATPQSDIGEADVVRQQPEVRDWHTRGCHRLAGAGGSDVLGRDADRHQGKATSLTIATVPMRTMRPRSAAGGIRRPTRAPTMPPTNDPTAMNRTTHQSIESRAKRTKVTAATALTIELSTFL